MNIETNTQELREILETVYNLPNAGGNGSAKADLVITGMPFSETGTDNYFALVRDEYNGRKRGPEYITFDQEQVVSAYEKLINGGDVRAALQIPAMFLNSWEGLYATTYQGIRVAAGRDPISLVVRFECAGAFLGSAEGTYSRVEYVFSIDTANRTATLSNCFMWNA